MDTHWAILLAPALLLAGFVLRTRLRILRALFVPASVAGGLLGLLLLQAVARYEPARATAGSLADELRTWPAALIAVVFAGLLLIRSEKRVGRSLRGAALAGIAVWVIVLGEIALGLAATGLLIAPLFDVPPAFGQLIEAGFAGGHGTAAALGAIYDDMLDFPQGRDLALFMATVGLVYSIASGMVFVNIAVRRGWTRSNRAGIDRGGGPDRRGELRPVAFGRVASEIIDPLALQIAFLALAFLLGVLLRMAFIGGARLVVTGDALGYVENVPLFLFTLLGGGGVHGIMRLLRVDHLIDAESMKRLVAVAMEFLIVAAIASLKLDVVQSYLGPLALLCGLGFAWTAFCLVGLSRWILPDGHWFELGILNYGMSTGTTAQGVMLLRIVDPDLESRAAEEYALAAPLSAPFIGGGVLTMSLPLILTRVPLPAVIVVITVAVVGLAGLGILVKRARGGA